MKSAALSNLKKVTLELGGKSPNIIFASADLDQAAAWSAMGGTFTTRDTVDLNTKLTAVVWLFTLDSFLQLWAGLLRGHPAARPGQLLRRVHAQADRPRQGVRDW